MWQIKCRVYEISDLDLFVLEIISFNEQSPIIEARSQLIEFPSINVEIFIKALYSMTTRK